MSKLQLKQHVQSLTREQVIDLLMQVYDADKGARQWLDYYLQPEPDNRLEQCKRLITEEFYPAGGGEPTLRLPVCRQIILDFKKLKPGNEQVAELMVYFVETACRYAHDNELTWDQYYQALSRHFVATMKFLKAHDLIARFQPSLDNILHYAQNCAWGFDDIMNDIYSAYTSDNE